MGLSPRPRVLDREIREIKHSFDIEVSTAKVRDFCHVLDVPPHGFSNLFTKMQCLLAISIYNHIVHNAISSYRHRLTMFFTLKKSELHVPTMYANSVFDKV